MFTFFLTSYKTDKNLLITSRSSTFLLHSHIPTNNVDVYLCRLRDPRRQDYLVMFWKSSGDVIISIPIQGSEERNL